LDFQISKFSYEICIGITFGYGLSAIWFGILAMELIKLSIYTIALHRVDWDLMSDRAVNAMEKAPEATLEDVEDSAVNYMTAIVRIPALDSQIHVSLIINEH